MNESMATSREVARFLRVSEGTLRNWRSEGSGPKFERVGRSVRYDWAEVRRWSQQSTAEAEREQALPLWIFQQWESRGQSVPRNPLELAEKLIATARCTAPDHGPDGCSICWASPELIALLANSTSSTSSVCTAA